MEAGYLGVGATWALGLSSSAAQLQANPASLPKALLDITGVIPFEQTIFLWQSLVVAAVLLDAEVCGGIFTLEQLLKKMRELLRPGRTLAAGDVQAVLPELGHCLAPARDRWRWKHREPAYPG